ncbi:MAG: ECF transporter S component [Candidatus Latescibacteria bacterium]|nr:ECF transporter S component [Candidatus Latescibacterota bacterium]
MAPRRLTLNALLVALTVAATLVIRVPTPATQGYINLGDAVIFAAALLFGPRTGLLAGGLGSALADLLGGYVHWAPFTLVIKGLEGALVGLIFRGSLQAWLGVLIGCLAACVGGAWMVFGYFLTESFLYGWQPAVATIPGNTVQALGSLLVGIPVAVALARAGIGGRGTGEGPADSREP